MYNDYYLQQIYEKIGTTNTNLEEILESMEQIKTNQETLISGDIYIKQEIEKTNHKLELLNIIIVAILLYLFIVRCMK